MAIMDSSCKFVRVVQGDTLSEIAINPQVRKYSHNASWHQLAAINRLSNPHYLSIGQKIFLTTAAYVEYHPGSGSSSSGSSSGSSSSGSSSGSSKSTSTTNSNMATVTQFGLQSNSDGTLFAVWTWSKKYTANYEAEWCYDTGDGVWFIGNKSTTEDKQSTYGIPSNAKRVRFRVKPIAQTYDTPSGQSSRWTASWSTAKTYDTSNLPPQIPSAPSAEIDKYKLTAVISDIDADELHATGIQFQIVKNDTTIFKTGKSTINKTVDHVSYSCTVEAGGDYKVRCRSYRGNTYSDWSGYSSVVGTIPSTPSKISSIKATSETSILLKWTSVKTAKSYDIEYTTKKSYFDISDQTTVVSNIETTSYEKTGLESGQEYFFRVRAVNDAGHSSWSGIKSVIIGDEPGVPTTWSSTTTAVVGEDLKLYWVHNSEDGSSETSAELELYINGVKSIKTIKNTETDEDEKDKTKVYSVNTSVYSEGTQIQWRVRTAGITKVYGEWSVQRTIDVYAPPVLTLSVVNAEGDTFDTLTSFPFTINAFAGPNTQSPIGYHVTISSNEIYETVDNVGNVKMVNVGEAVYSKHFDITDALSVEMSPANVNLDNNINYTITCVVTMNSGLTAEAAINFTVSWDDVVYTPNAEINIDTDALTAYVRPYCEEGSLTRYKVTRSGYNYTKTEEVIEGGVYGTLVDGVTTSTGEDVYDGTTDDGTVLYYCEVETYTIVEGVTLSLYRREFDGSFTELATGLQNTDNTFVTDPHPALDYARYRVVAISDSTGSVSFYDVPGCPTGVTDIVIQWAEAWSNFDTDIDDELEQPPWSGSLMRLPYDIDWSESTNQDVALVNYAGREHPVSYYGTQVGQAATGNTNIPYDDVDTIYALRRLQRWMGDVYIREPSGSGYWANIKVQFSQKHCDVYVPVTLTITRVEGGI